MMKRQDRLCIVITALTLVAAIAMMLMGAAGIGVSEGRVMGYESRLFDAGSVHTINIEMDDWDAFIASCEDEEYVECDVTIDGERYASVGIRAKGNTSLSNVKSMDSQRYSFKIEFDKYNSAMSYHGLDKLSLNNIIQDNTFMKDFLAYQMMNFFGVDAPLCSYVYITVGGEDWGLYLAVEGVEDGFLQRTKGGDYGELYKPDSMSMGGGRGNGMDFDMNEIMEQFEGLREQFAASADGESGELTMPDMSEIFGGRGGGMGGGGFGGGMGGFSMGSSDTKLQYIDDDPSSYSNIFDNAKTDISDADSARLIAALKALGEGDSGAVDVDAVIRYFVVHNFLCNFDSYTGSIIHNYYLYEEDGVLSMIPWDYNLAFGSFQASGDATEMINYPIDSPVSGGSTEDRPMIDWIFQNEEYLALYHEYFADFIAEYFDSGYFTALFESTTEMIAPYVEKDPTKFCTTEEFETAIDALGEFCIRRAGSVSGQLNGSIPSTSEGQAADDSALIDGSDINISDMGSMGMGGGKGGFNMDFENMPQGGMMPGGEGAQTPPTADTTAPMSADTAQAPADTQQSMQGGQGQGGGRGQGGMSMPDGTSMPDGMQFPTDGETGSEMQIPDMSGFMGGSSTADGSTSAVSADMLIQVGISALILLAGILFAWRYKRP